MKLVAFDVETSGTLPEYALQPCRVLTGDAWLTSYAWCDLAFPAESAAVHGHIEPTPTVENLRAFLQDRAERGETIVGWNTPFDVAWLIAMGLREEVLANKWLDAMLLWRHLTISPDVINSHPKSYSLKAAVMQFLPHFAGYEKDVDFHATDPESIQKRLHYNMIDAHSTFQLTQKFLEGMPENMLRCAVIEASCIPMVAESMVTGLAIDPAAANALDAKLDEAAKVAFVTLRMSGEAVTPEVLASPKQLATLLFETWGLKARKLTEKGSISTDKEVLQELAVQDSRAALVHTYRESNNNRKKFVTAPLTALEYNGDGRVRPAAKIYGTYTGRMTYSSKQGRGVNERQTGCALHQWKRGKEFRSLVVAPEGYDLLEFDFSGQEYRWMAVESRDPTMLQLCQPGENAHAYMGARIANMEYRHLIADVDAEVPGAYNKRQLGKVANLSCQYRTSAGTLQRVARVQYGVNMSEVESCAVHATYQTTYRMVPQYWKQQIYKAKKFGYVETIAGRRIQLLTGEHWTAEKRWGIESTAINFPIQGAGADQKYLALAVLKKYLPKVDGRFYFELHDGMFVVVPKAKSLRAAHEIKHLLSNLPYKKAWNVSLPIQFPVDAKIGSSWGSLKVIHED